MAREPFNLSIFGPQAVGKMTVGFEVQRLTGASLLHGHMLVDLLTEFFEVGSEPFVRLATAFRREIIEEAARAGTNLVGTGVPPFGDPAVMCVIEDWADLVSSAGGEPLYVELDAPLSVRLDRNRSELRRASKKTDWASDEVMAALSEQHTTVAEAGVTLPGRHIVIDNSQLSASAAAEVIVAKFDLPRVTGVG